MTVNIFSLEMAAAYLKGAEPPKHLLYTPQVLDSYYKLFTTGFETESSVVNCVERDGRYIALVDNTAFVATPGCMVKTGRTARVLKIDKRDNKCELTLDKEIAPGKLTVCGLGFVAVGKDETARTITVRDSIFGNEMIFKLNFRDTENGIKRDESLVEVTVLGTTTRLLHQSSYAGATNKTYINIGQWNSWRSFISNGSWLWFNVKYTNSEQTSGLFNFENFFCGWISRTEFVGPNNAWRNQIYSCSTGNFSGVGYTDEYICNIMTVISSGGTSETVTPLLFKPWACNTLIGQTGVWMPTFSTSVEGLGSGYLLWSSKMVKLPGIQYAPIVSYHPTSDVFEYGDKLIYTSDAAYGNIPHYFSLDDKDWVQDE